MDASNIPAAFTAEVREERVAHLEKIYESTNGNLENENRMQKVYNQIADKLGSEDTKLLWEYTDRLIARFNVNVDWFYDKGFSDALILTREDANGTEKEKEPHFDGE